jgi:hypothetical protein
MNLKKKKKKERKSRIHTTVELIASLWWFSIVSERNARNSTFSKMLILAISLGFSPHLTKEVNQNKFNIQT